MKTRILTAIIATATVTAATVGVAFAGGMDDPSQESLNAAPSGQEYSPYVDKNYPTTPLWGDTHVHTSLSTDAGLAGNILPPAKAYEFARGDEITSSFGHRVRLSRPLDWLAVADHSDGMGMITDLIAGDPEVLQFEQAAAWYEGMNAGGKKALEAKMDLVRTFSAGEVDPGLVAMYSPGSKPFKNLWEYAVSVAEAYNEPGDFTTMIGFEWTSLIEGNNMHRVVLLRDNGTRARQIVPFTMTPPQGSPDPTDLWKYMAGYEAKTGGEMLAIPHNANLSNGIMFPLENRWNGEELTPEYVAQRTRWEPLVEVTQIKGDGETHPLLSPDDEFADFETWDIGNLGATEAKTDDMLAGEYARSALLRGLKLGAGDGANPYQFGMIGSTDSHTSLAATEEDNFFGKNSIDEPHPGRVNYSLKVIGDRELRSWQSASSGLTAVWSRENTRGSIFDAMLRKEVYGTTGTRMTVRLFGGWDFTENDLKGRSPAKVGYNKGVPMGANLRAQPEGDAKSPTLMVYAMRDPMGANLDRIQIVKGWTTADGGAEEMVYNVDWSDNRAIDANGALPAVGNTVDVATATWVNSIGASELGKVWTDPDFDASQHVFYYARVLEIPTPRWSTYDAVHFGVDIPEGAPVAIQERAYSSPIWYQPGS